MSKHLPIENYVAAVRLEGGIYTKLPTTFNGTTSNSFTVGPNGTTNPTLNVDSSATNAVTGINITSSAAGSGVAITTTSTGSAETLNISAKSTGFVNIGSLMTTQRIVATASNANAVAVGQNGSTNPAFAVDSSTATSVTGVKVKSGASGGGAAISLISNSTDENLTVSAKGAGSVIFNSAVVATAGGAVNDGIQYGSLSVGLYTGTGAPSFSAMNGSIYTDSNATTTTTRIYVNKSGAGTAGTTWTALTTAA